MHRQESKQDNNASLALWVIVGILSTAVKLGVALVVWIFVAGPIVDDTMLNDQQRKERAERERIIRQLPVQIRGRF